MATALRLDESLSDTYNALAAFRLYVERDWPAADEAFRRALDLNANDAETRNHYGLSLALFGRIDEAVEHIERAIRIDPLALRFHRNLAFVLYQAGRYDEAIEECLKTAELNPAYTYVCELLGDAYQQKGSLGDALTQWERATQVTEVHKSSRGRGKQTDRDTFNAALNRLWQPRLAAMMQRLAKREFVPAIDVARAYARMGYSDEALIWLQKASHERKSAHPRTSAGPAVRCVTR